MRAVPGFPGYLVTENGEVYSIRQGAPRAISRRQHRGNWHVNVKAGLGRGTKRKRPVAELVLLAFHGPRPSALHRLRHLDGDLLNDSKQNLAWGTLADQAEDAIRHGTASCIRRGEDHNRTKINDASVVVIRAVRGGLTQQQIADAFGITQKHVSDILLKRTRIASSLPLGG